MDDPSVKGTFHKKNETNVTGGTLQTRCDLKAAGLFTLGLSAERQDFESRGRIRDVEDTGGGGDQTYDFRSFDVDRDVDIYFASIEYEFSPLKNVGMIVGYGKHWFNKEDSKSDNEDSFLVGAYYDVFKKTRISGSVARKIRFPSIKQLCDEDTGNPDLTTEKSYNYEVGIEQELPGDILASLTGFLMDVDDYIEKDDFTDLQQNYDEYRFHGIELTAETRFFENLLLRMGYTYMYSDDRSSGSERDELQHRPEHKLTFEGKYSFQFGLSTYVDVMRVADQYHYSRKAPLIKEKFNDYTLVNMKLAQELLNGRLSLYLGADNLFDEDYEESYGFPQAGLTIYGGIDFRF